MTDDEIKLKCVELALGMAVPDRSSQNVVKVAQEVYTFVKAPVTVAGTQQPLPEDKQKRSRSAKPVDPLS